MLVVMPRTEKTVAFPPKVSTFRARSNPLSTLFIMAVVIRLRQEGARHRPVFRIVATDKRIRREGRFLEILGAYDPQKGIENATVKLDRVNDWISKGAKPSDTVASIIKHATKAGA